MTTSEDITILARTIYGEARGSTDRGRRAVAHVILNRWRDPTRRQDHTIAATCLRWRQFSCWNPGDPNRPKLMDARADDPVYQRCMLAALDALREDDMTLGSTHYHNRSVSPNWAQGHAPAFQTADHAFYNDVR